MPIAPNEAEDLSRMRDTHPLEWICKQIDAELVDNVGTGTALGILRSRFNTPALEQLVINEYRKAGWRVSLERDEEQGDHIRIET
ncbi:MAG: hypothetical protein JWN28_701 [Candidatus Saccharibacteria bacterium]|nr:hypothetical protein [Candidatus Saccharibacteria bacterium]